uniref:protein moonraker-like n=1 Tax=Oncorhynchus gorbuscha TaxID=8017 RepID=UPI001EAEE959|nr:protein moonraker-like [Oncorhynchus gorbuscha]XP_046150154.1 protein moonraker-like [Oncorhynchus gorbuscha]XP_046150155.1 protein moonraker-like [Oncorhynchus gorbuscha]XP_046150156.1 protein moonraker-like [Oncorhynchus gorbuscha]XP_046150157.1 protein moonraker-like [Oncorhynchus gorbuscha]
MSSAGWWSADRNRQPALHASSMCYNNRSKEIQKDLDKLRSQKIDHTNKSRSMDRLAAAQRGAIRAMQRFTNQLSDTSEGRMPSHCKELGQLIRQLSLCSAKVEVGQGSAIPETALDILQKLGTLDTALRSRRVQYIGGTPEHAVPPLHAAARLPPHPRAPRGSATRGLRGPRRAAGPKKSFPAK